MSEKQAELKKLLELFEHNIKQYKGKHYDEAKARADFIDKFFLLLGWDVYNKKGWSEQYREVVREDKVKIKGKMKAPDYSFRTGGMRKFFVEAKKPSVDIKHDIGPAFQLRRYAYTAKLPLSILTDFEELAVYDTRIKPHKNDKASVGRIFYCTYDEYEKEFDFLYDTFSFEGINKGSFDKYIEDNKRKKGTSEVDKEFLKLIEQWRENLAKNIALRNKELSIYELNYAVQKIIDRIIFLRIAEDRQVEEYGLLQGLLENKEPIYPQLVEIFAKADYKYNSGLFNFKEDQLTQRLEVDDKVFKEIIGSIYPPDSPYEFSVFDVEILGNIYEQFLGKTIRLTPAHQAKVEDKPEVKKAGGVYYTPKYIVEYIVKNTVGEKIKDRKPEDVAGLKILDPACGSGSFLLGAYQLLLDFHLQYYTGNNHAGSSKQQNILKKALKESKIFQLAENDYRLTIEEKQRILSNNIYGVDIDSQAVEVTKLSLLLKLMEGESQESTGLLFKFSDVKLLPDLSDNIKCGNSLIGSDFYESGQLSLFQDEETVRRINVFDWEKEFAPIFSKGGFDVVIGNPPYIRQEMLGEFKNYFKDHYQVYNGIADIYVYFIEKGINLLKQNGLFGIIVANKWMRAGYGEQLRKYLKQKNILEIIDFGDLPVFEQATTYPCILLVSNALTKGFFKAANVDTLSFQNLSDYINSNGFQINAEYLNDEGWALRDEKEQKLLNKIKSIGKPLGEYVEDKIFYGIKTGFNKAFVITKDVRDKLIEDDYKSVELIKPFAAGRDIKRYNEILTNNFLILIPNGWTKKQCKSIKGAWEWFSKSYPAIANHLLPFADDAKKRYDKGDFWWELRACVYYSEFEKHKIMLPDISLKGNFAIDLKGEYYCTNTAYIIGSSDKYLLGILNSKLITLYYRNLSSTYRGGYLRFIYQYIKQLPIRAIDFEDKEEKVRHDEMVELVDQMLEIQKRYHGAKLETEKTLFKKQIDILDSRIDQLVYRLYDLSDEEIKIVEGEDLG